MSTMVLPEWLEGTANSVQRAVDSYDRRSERTRKDILLMVAALQRAVRDLYKSINKDISDGVEIKSYVAACTPMIKGLETLLKKTLELQETMPQKIKGDRALRLRIAVIVDDVKQTLDLLHKVQEIAGQHRIPFDKERLRRGREDANAGRTQDSGAIIRRLKSGGEI